jgi:HEAT repeat protein
VSGNSLVDELGQRLNGADEADRYKAAKALARLDQESALPLVLHAIGDESARVRHQATVVALTLPFERVLSTLERYLRDEARADWRSGSIETLVAFGNVAIDTLVRWLRDDDTDVRMFSATMLGDIGDPMPVEALCDSLSDADGNVVQASAEALGKIGDVRAVPRLVGCLKTEFWMQAAALKALGQIGDPSPIAAICEAATDDTLRPFAIQALGRIGDVSTVTVLCGMLARARSGDRRDLIAAMVELDARLDSATPAGMAARREILTALGANEIRDQLMLDLNTDDDGLRRSAMGVLSALGEPRAIPRLVELLADYDLAQDAFDGLVAIGRDAVPELLSALTSPMPGVRLLAVRCLGHIDDPQARRAGLRLLGDELANVRAHAALAAVGLLEAEEVESAVVASLRDDNEEVRASAIRLLSTSPSATLVDRLLAVVHDAKPGVRAAAIEILGKRGATQAVPTLRQCYGDSSPRVRAEVCRALALLAPSDTAALAVLETGLKDQSAAVRAAAARSLPDECANRLRDKLAALWRDNDLSVRLAACARLALLGDAASVGRIVDAYRGDTSTVGRVLVDAARIARGPARALILSRLISESSAYLRTSALEHLGQAGDEGLLPKIVAVLDDPEWEVRHAAVLALGRLGSSAAVEPLLAHLDDEEILVRTAAVTVLGQLRAQAAVPQLVAMLVDPRVRDAVLTTLAGIGIANPDVLAPGFGRLGTRVKQRLIDIVARLHAETAVPWLVRVVATELALVRERAVVALGTLGGAVARQTLERVAREDADLSVRGSAAAALAHLEPRR